MADNDPLIEANALYDKLSDSNWRIIDCRFDLAAPEAGRAAYLNAHIPGAVYAHLDQDLSGDPVTDCGRHPMPSPERIKRTFERFGISDQTHVVVYDDQASMLAARAWWMLRYIGHQRVSLLNGGWAAWQTAALPTDSGEQEYSPGHLSLQVAPERLLVHDDIRRDLALIDAREPRRYRGEFEPIDARAGHIPGAKNHFFAKNLDESQKFLAPAQIKAGFMQSLGRIPDERTVHYCGSGVSACQNIFAQVYAGLPEPRLYGGSWSEWAKLAAESEGADV